MNKGEALRLAAARLATVSDTPRLDSELLMAFALGLDRDQLLLQPLDGEAPLGFDSLVERRLAHEPIAYILGRRDFWSVALEVGPGVLVPRPDSETLIEAAIHHFADRPPATILDLGTGPGTLLLAALDQWPGAVGLGIDRSQAALKFARRNAARLGFASRSEFRCGDWAEGIDRRFDLVLCNPPYVSTAAILPPDVREWEPAEALFAGADGLDDYRRLAAQLPLVIEKGGMAAIEIGAGQESGVSALFAGQGLAISSRADLNALVRCLVLRPDAR